MAEIGRPRGLIDYATLDGCKSEAAGAAPVPIWKQLLRPRTVIYTFVWVGIGAGLLFALGTRSHTDLTVSADRNPPFMLMKDGSVRNAFTLRLRNMEGRPREMEIAVSGLPGALMWTDFIDADAAAQTQVITVPADESRTVRAYVTAPKGTVGKEFEFVLTSQDEQREQDTQNVTFAAPEGL